MKLETDSINLMNMKVYNSQTAPANIRDLNQQTVNNLYLTYFAKTPDAFYQTDSLMTDADLATLESIAAQCYVVGGPAVIQARSMYWIATNSMDLSFQDYCLNTTGFYKTNPNDAGSTETKMPYTFKVYPNPINKGNSINVFTSEPGDIEFYNALGQSIYRAKLNTSINMFDCGQFDCETGIVFYKAKLQNGKTEIGKVIIIR